jgi:phenylpyruvate tautomerase PptA (4-oxalocrotonate tautomerase family)
MPIVSIKAKQHPSRTPEKIDGLISEVRQVIARHLEIPLAKVMITYEESSAGVWWDGESNRPGTPKK